MPAMKKYTDFHEGIPVKRRGKQAPYDERSYVGITCPHCNHSFEVCVDALKSRKASLCLTHLRVCTEYDGEVAPKKQTIATADVGVQAMQVEVASLEEKNACLEAANAELEEDKRRLRDCAAQFAEEEMKQCFFDFGAGMDSATVDAKMKAAVKQWGRARQEKTIRELGL